jgi:hypothetical protein
VRTFSALPRPISRGQRCADNLQYATTGPDQTVNVGATVQLDGSGSMDPNAAPLTYAWSLTTKPAGSAAVLSSANTVTPTFVADLAGTYVAQLIVNNGVSDSTPDTVTVEVAVSVTPTATVNLRPTVNCPADITVPGATVSQRHLAISAPALRSVPAAFASTRSVATRPAINPLSSAIGWDSQGSAPTQWRPDSQRLNIRSVEYPRAQESRAVRGGIRARS